MSIGKFQSNETWKICQLQNVFEIRKETENSEESTINNRKISNLKIPGNQMTKKNGLLHTI